MAAPAETRHEKLAQARSHQQAEHQEQRRRQQVNLLAQLDCLRGVPSLELLRLAHLCTIRAFPMSAEIVSEHSAAEFAYLVLSGTVSLKLHDRDGFEALIGVLGRGDCFGEGPLFGDVFRGATVYAESTCYLLQLPLAELRGLLAETPQLDSALRAIYRRRLVERILARVPIFSKLSPFERARIAALLQARHYPRGSQILQFGSPGNALFLIESGQVVVERHGQAIAHLDEGDFFGEMSLLSGNPHNADIRSLTPTDVLMLPAQEFSELLAQQPLLAEQVQAVAERRRVATVDDTVRAERLALVVEHGMLRGTRLLVRDPARCEAGCTICETACATRHGQSRIRITGVLLDEVAVTDTCRQCRVGPECVEACPSDALEWNSYGALVVNDRCTGCGQCVPACPYDAMTLVAQHQPTNTSPLWALWGRLRHLRNPTIPLEPAKPTHRADKCDLCHGHNDLACVSACPTGALRLVPVEEIFVL